MYLEHPDISREWGNSHLEDLIAEARAERLADEIRKQNSTAHDVRETLLRWLPNWRKPSRRIAPRGI